MFDLNDWNDCMLIFFCKQLSICFFLCLNFSWILVCTLNFRVLHHVLSMMVIFLRTVDMIEFHLNLL